MSELDNLLKDINKQYKDNIAFNGLERKDFVRIPFSSPRMNYITYGGIARNTITELSGEESSGKTTTALDLIKNAQKIFEQEDEGKRIVYIDAENTLDEEWASKLGVDISQLILIRPQDQTTEQILDIAEKVIETKEVGLVVIDSIAVMVPQQVYDESYEKKSYGGNSLPLTRFVSKIVPMLRKFDCTLIIINQVRQDLDNPYNEFKTTGGQALKHQCSLRLAFRQGKKLDDKGNEVNNSFENPSGHKVICHVLKTKICRPDRKLGFYTLNYLEGIDWVTDLIDVAMKYSFISQGGAWYYINDENGEVTEKFQGKLKLIERIKSDTEFTNNLLKLVNEQIKKFD